MKQLALSLLLLQCAGAFASTIDLEPGSRITISPGDTTVVSCGGSSNGPLSKCKCVVNPTACGGYYKLVQLRKFNGTDSEVIQSYAENKGYCDSDADLLKSLAKCEREGLTDLRCF